MEIESAELDQVTFEEMSDITDSIMTSVWNGHDITMNPEDRKCLEYWLRIQQDTQKTTQDKNATNRNITLLASSQNETETETQNQNEDSQDERENLKRSYSGRVFMEAAYDTDGQKELDVGIEIEKQGSQFSGSVRGSISQDREGKTSGRVEGRLQKEF